MDKLQYLILHKLMCSVDGWNTSRCARHMWHHRNYRTPGTHAWQPAKASIGEGEHRPSSGSRQIWAVAGFEHGHACVWLHTRQLAGGVVLYIQIKEEKKKQRERRHKLDLLILLFSFSLLGSKFKRIENNPIILLEIMIPPVPFPSRYFTEDCVSQVSAKQPGVFS